MGFIINLTIALILFTVEAMKGTKREDDDRETTQCEARAYLTLYFFLVSNLCKTILIRESQLFNFTNFGAL